MQSRVDIVAVFNDLQAEAEIARLKTALRGLSEEQNRIQSTTFDPFSRAQVRSQIENLENLRTSIQRTIAEVTVASQTVGGDVGVRSLINSLVGADRAIKSASASARVLKQSLSDVAAEDSRLRDVRAAFEAAQATPRPRMSHAEAEAAFLARPHLTSRTTPRESISEEIENEAKLQTALAAARTAMSMPVRQVTRDEEVEQAESRLQRLRTKVVEYQNLLNNLGRADLRRGMGTALQGAIEDAENQIGKLQKTIGLAGINLQELNKITADSSVSTFAAARAWKMLQEGNVESARTILTVNNSLQRNIATSSDAARSWQIHANETARANNVLKDLANTESRLGRSKGADIAGLFGKIETSGFASAERGVKHLEEAHWSLGRTVQHVTAIIDGALRGQRGQVSASIVALVRDAGILRTAIALLVSPFGAVAAAGVAAMATLGYAIEQQIQRLRSIRESTESLGLQGFGTTEVQQGQQFDAIKNEYNEFNGVIRQLQVELTKLPPAAQSSWRGFIDLAEAFARIHNTSPVKALEEIVKEANKGKESYARWIETTLGFEGKLDSSGRSLREVAATIANTSEAFYTLNRAAVSAPMVKIADDARKVSLDIWGVAAAATAASEALGQIDPNVLKKLHDAFGVLEGPQFRLPQDIIDSNKAITAGNKVLTERQTIQDRINQLQSRLNAEQAGEGGGDPERIREITHTIQSLRQQLEHLHDPVEQRQFDVGRLVNVEKMRESASDIQKQIQIQTDNLRRAQEFYGKGVPTAEVGRIPQVQEEQNRLRDLERQGEKLSVEIEIERQKNLAAEAQRGTQERLNAAREAERLTRESRFSPSLGGELMFDPRAIQQSGHQVASTIEQINSTEIQSARARARGEIDAAEGSATKIISIYRQLFAEIGALGAKSSVFRQLQEEEIKDLRSVQAKMFAATEQFQTASERLDSIKIQSFRAGLAAQVAAHQISKEQMAGFEAQFSAQVLGQEEQRTQAIIDSGDLTTAQKERMYEHLSELYAKDAENQIKAQEEATKAIEAENQRRMKSFTQVFDAIGSGFEKFVDAALNKTETRGQALLQLSRSIVSSLVSGAASMASKFAGEALGPKLGLTDEQSKGGLGEVLGNAVAKSLGFLKESPKDQSAAAQAKFALAVDAQSKAADLQKNAANELHEAATDLKSAADALKSMPSATRTRSGSVAPAAKVPDTGFGPPSVDTRLTTGNLSTDTAALQQLKAIIAEGSKSLPSGYSVEAISTIRPGARVAGTGGVSQHALGDAMDVRIVGPSGAIPAMGEDPTGMYKRLAEASLKAQQQLYPELAGKFASGTQFGKMDAGHFDLGGDRGSRGKLSVDSDSVSRGVAQGFQQSASQQQEAIKQANSDLTSTQNATKAALDNVKTSDDKLVAALDKNTEKQQQPSSASAKPQSDSSTSTTSGFGMLTQGLGIASSAAAMFGNNLSTTARMILGAVGVISQLSSFTKTLSSTFNLFDSTTKLATTATAAQTVSTQLQTTANATETLSTQTLSAAQSTAAAGSGIGSIFKAIPFIGGLFASGTTSTPAGGIVVGEQGPELIYQPGGLGVLNASMTRNMLSPSGRIAPSNITLPGLGRPTFAMGSQTTNNNPTANMSYSPQLVGRFGSMSRTELSSILRSHGDSFEAMARNWIRNGAMGYR